MNIGLRNRAVSATAMNDRSSRSHSCLTVHVQGRELTSGTVIRGSMHLVDLAGSERVDKSEVTGDRLKEAQHINKSLSALGDVIASLAQKNSHVPYRNSKLTQLLQDSLGGQAKTLMFVHMSPETDALGETISTLKFAERVATVELGAARVNKDSSEAKELKEQIANLKASLASKEGESEHSHHSRSSTPERLKMKSGLPSPSHSWYSAGSITSSHRKIEDGNSEVRNNYLSVPTRRRSLDPQDLIMYSPPWPIASSHSMSAKEDDRESVSSDWVDKVMMNRLDSANRDENPAGQWEVDSTQSPEMFYQSYARDPSKIYPEQPYKSPPNTRDSQEYDAQRGRFEIASTDESDELEAATSDSSEPDLLWQSNIPRMSSLPNPNVLGSKTKKTTYPRGFKSTETRSLIPSLIPSPSRKLPHGVSPGLNKAGRQLVSVDGKRKNWTG
ncbi:KINESIN-LIKE PROTEIN KLP-3 [Salix purpurea]|nr:KINESIN-LIKE PROTEIN KLP-3 [Salix purpurea]